ncbi:MAG: hypothetical protein ABI882_11350 [Acidobacteriota bacterium]
MQRKMFLATLFTAVMTVGFVALPVNAFSDWVGVYAVIDKVVLEPNATAPERIQIWGDFAVADKNDRNTYQQAQRGYVYYTVPSGKEVPARKEWADLKAMAGTGQVIGFGTRYQGVGKVRKSDEKPGSPDPYPVGSGLVKMSDRGTTYAPIAELKAIARPKGQH